MNELLADIPPGHVELFADRLYRLQYGLKLSKDEARVVAGCGSMAAFERWAKKSRVRPIEHGYYSGPQIRKILADQADWRKAPMRRAAAINSKTA